MRSPLILLTLLALNLLGCTPFHQGNFTKAPLELNTVVINDSLTRLKRLYPPARTRFHLNQSVKDAFGLALIDALRKQGYSVNESSIHSLRAEGMGEVALSYLIDAPVKGSLYSVTLIIGRQSISRAYTLKKGLFTPIGLWGLREYA